MSMKNVTMKKRDWLELHESNNPTMIQDIYEKTLKGQIDIIDDNGTQYKQTLTEIARIKQVLQNLGL